MPWPALHAATAHDEAARLPFELAGRWVGSVARKHLALLAEHAPWIEQRDDSVRCARVDAAAFATLHRRLRDAGAILAWRDEPFTLFDPDTLEPLATIERAAARFWGTLTLGAHANGFVRGEGNEGGQSRQGNLGGRPTHLWIARRSPRKATDPGLLDNLVGGGVPAGQSPRETLVREGFEEAGLGPAVMAAAQPASTLRLHRDIREGFQHEWLYSFDLELPHGLVPHNQDGEVAEFVLLSLAEVTQLLHDGEAMTTDAALVTLDFLVRHGVLDEAALASRLEALRVPPSAARA